MEQNQIKVVSIRLVDEPPLYSSKPILGPEVAVEVIGKELQQYDRELLCVLNLSSNNQIINFNVVSIGTLNAASAHPREVFKSAILSNAAGVMLIHNHPSGNPTPSREDIRITDILNRCGTLLGIDIIDHIITGRHGQYTSLREKGLLRKSNQKLDLMEPKHHFKI